MFDRDFTLNTVSVKDTRLRKRKYKLYKGFRKEELKAYTGEEVAKYFEGLNNTQDVVYIFRYLSRKASLSSEQNKS
jgi:hypothetical protein